MTKRKQMKIVNRLVNLVLDNLSGRKGFDFRSLPKSLRAEIVADLTMIVWDELYALDVFSEEN